MQEFFLGLARRAVAAVRAWFGRHSEGVDKPESLTPAAAAPHHSTAPDHPVIVRIEDRAVAWGPDGTRAARIESLAEDGLSVYETEHDGDFVYFVACFWGNRSKRHVLASARVLVFTESELRAVGDLRTSASNPPWPPRYSSRHRELFGHSALADRLVDIVEANPSRLRDVDRQDVYREMARIALVTESGKEAKDFRRSVKQRMRWLKENDAAAFAALVAMQAGLVELIEEGVKDEKR